MDERLLRFFVAVYETKNVSRAAEKCHVSQPNISNGIKQLEELIGKTLFLRHKRGVELNEEAHYLYPIAKRILGELNSIPSLFKEEILKQKVTVGIADSLPQSFKSQFFAAVSKEIKNLEWDVRPMNRDCEINILVREWKYEEHLFLPLFKEEYVLCVPINHPLAKKDSIDNADLIDVAFIHCPPCEAHQQCLSILNSSGSKWNTIANCSTKNEVLTLLIAGLGISFLPKDFASGWDGFVIKEFNGPHYYREVGFSYAKESLRNPAVKQLIDLYS
ncbi:LysR family transcriptional regulator [Flammeovirga kamogawensis]|uniref:LysR family transcriptional regulator n=1 Tax=Flammeovirga kamogawensis TaxID=373891 RepID=A0ABX8H397_9BACT|nr:LysR family transcriptional regulator [Flammeovirga kamogawensis]MBB6460324.1 DNA-binding transcriptional LysR family regulator [Flammeovirga kamogawensis]QWG10133.1 LysR family transcriptional regulator [Flammeovirga kamogawensis]TRX65642.1 LysR family transcriptional regulator [Flammeovirga kamogawensis]